MTSRSVACMVALSAAICPISLALCIQVVTVYLQFFGPECTAADLNDHRRSGLLVLREAVATNELDALSRRINNVSAEYHYFCGVNTHPLDDYSRRMRQRCKLSFDELCSLAPEACSVFSSLDISRPGGAPVAQPIPFSKDAVFVRMHAPSHPWKAVLLAFVHSIYVLDLERWVCPTRPWLCQGFHGFHLDDEDLLPERYNRLLLMVAKAEARHSNLRVLPRGALAATARGAEARLRAWPSPLRQLAAGVLQMAWAAHMLFSDEHQMQLGYALAGCTARMSRGDVLVMAWDVRHQTQGTLIDRTMLILPSCATCDDQSEAYAGDVSREDAEPVGRQPARAAAGELMRQTAEDSRQGRRLAQIISGEW